MLIAGVHDYEVHWWERFLLLFVKAVYITREGGMSRFKAKLLFNRMYVSENWNVDGGTVRYGWEGAI
jgi:hypothetical protein